MAEELGQNRMRWSPPLWLLLLWLPFVAVVVGAVTVDVTQKQNAAAERRHVADLLAHVEAGAYRERLAVSRALGGLATPRVARLQVRLAAATMASDIAELQHLDPDDEQARTAELVDSYEQAVARELRLLDDGRHALAHEVDARSVGPRLERLVASVELARPRERAEADEAQAAARRGTILSVLVGLVGVLTPLLVFGLLRTRTRRALEHARRVEQSEHRFRALVQNASDTIVVVDRQGTIRAVHGAAGIVRGHEDGALVGTPLWEVVHTDDRLLAKALCDNAAGAGAETTDWRIAHSDGSWGPLRGRDRGPDR